MDIKNFIKENDFCSFPVGLGGCRASDSFFSSCDYDLFVFDEKKESDTIFKSGNDFVRVHHASLSETSSEKLLQFHNMQVIEDESWDLKMLLSKINERQSSLFADFAKNCLIESQFCCQKTRDALECSNVFAPCWQKCAIFYLADAISSINLRRSSSSHMLDLLRRFDKNPVNEHISTITQVVGIERATPTLLERMLKSTVGFSDLVEKNNRSEIIELQHDYFVKNSMISDCYFYLGYLNKENFIKIRDTLHGEEDLFHILKIAFDVEADSNLLLEHSDLIQQSCSDILGILSSA